MIYPRLLETEILKYIKDKQAIVILGARQVGKTSLMLRIKEILSTKYRCFYFDLEKPQDLEKLQQSVDDFVKYLEIIGADKNKINIVFIDEIHYLSDPAKFIKLAVDHYSSRIKLIVSGSSSLEIKKKFKESIVGRKFVFHLYPLNFYEFLIFKEKKELAEILPQNPFEDIKEDKSRFFINEYEELFKEFLIFGGYPAVVLAETIEKKIKLLEEIVCSYVYKDVRSLFDIEDIGKFNKFVKLLAVNSANLVNFSSLSVASGLSRYLVNQYTNVLEQTFIICLITPYFKGGKKELIKIPKVFFVDTGLRNFVVGDFQFDYQRQDIGALLENSVFCGLKKRQSFCGKLLDIHFWRTQNKTEIDFVIEKNGDIYPVEVNISGRPNRAIYSFIESFKLKKGYICYLGGYKRERKLTFIPLWWVG